MDVFIIAYYAALFALPMIIYKLLLPTHHGSEKRSKDWYYALKRILCHQKLSAFMNRPTSLPSNRPETPEEEWQEDLLTFHAVDLKKNAIYVRFAVGNCTSCQFAEILVQLRLADGRIFTLPEGILLCALRTNEWRTKVLTITRQLDGNYRLVFNGFLREIATDLGGFEHVAINCLASDPLQYPKSFDRSLFGDAACRVQWRDGNWTDNLGDQIGESHFGILHGTVKSKNFHLDATISMGAYQNRSYGTADRYECARSVEILMHADDGTLLFAQNKRTAYIPSAQVRHGAVLLPKGTCHAITACDLPLPDSCGNTTPMTIHTATRTRHIKMFLSVDDRTEVKHVSGQLQSGFNLINKLADTTTDTGSAVTSIIFFKRTLGTKQHVDLTPLVGDKICFDKLTSEDTILPLTNVNAQNVDLTGGKGQSLSILASLQTELNFAVPPGFVITTTAMHQHVNTGKNSAEFRSAMRQLKTSGDHEAIKSSCEKLQDIITNTPMSQDIQDGITREIKTLLLKNITNQSVSFAVRSSGVTEDSEVTSAAGQNETFLGCRTQDDIFDAVKKCWASLYAFRSVEYRRHHGLDVETAMAVVVQVMIDSRIAGVLFTCDLDGNPGRMRITSNYGLGESIVSGEEGGDIIYIHRTWNNNISIESQEIHKKKTKITLSDSGTRTVYLSDSSSKQMSISKEEALILAKIATRLEEKYGKHLDIEWAFDHNSVVLLQARPVTFLENWTDYELEHEFDTAITCARNIYTTANVKEVMPGAITPLANSTVIKKVDESVGMCVVANFNSNNAKSAHSKRQCIVTMRHHIFLDYFNVLMAIPSDKIDLTTRSIDFSVCGHPVTTQEMLRRSIAMNGRTTLFKKAWSIFDMLKYCRKVEAVIAAAKERASETIPPTVTSVHELISRIDRHLDAFTTVISAHTIASRVSSFYQMISMNVLSSDGGSSAGDGSELTPEKFAQISLLFSNGSGVISAEIPSDLEVIATEIRKSELRDEFVQASQDQAQAVIQRIEGARAKYEKFLQDHGHRSSREFEVIEKSWSKNTPALMKMLQTLAKLNQSTKKAAPLSVDEVVDRLNSNVNKRFLKFLVGKCRQGVVNREKSKSEVVRHINTLRGAFAQLGERLLHLQILPQADLVYYLTYDEIKHLVKGSDPVPIAKAMRRKRLYDTWNSFKFPEISSGMPEPIVRAETKFDNALAELSGTPVCAGRVTARCCCIDNLRDIDQLQQGDVLVTHGTDVGWTPYFPMLAGVVTELGGLISHGAVVAREYGLPCLVGVEGALNTFKTGDNVVLDSINGRLYKLGAE